MSTLLARRKSWWSKLNLPRRAFLVCLFLAFVMGCGGGPSPATPTGPSIITQPVDQGVAAGQSAAFSVVATGTGPLSFQWRWNEMVVPNATGPSFTTPPAVPSDNLSTLTVSVTNPLGTVTSMPVSLSVAGGPRPPKAGDLRFKDVGAFPLGLDANQFTGMVAGQQITFPNQVGSPLELAGPGGNVPMNDAWSFLVFNLPEGVSRRTTIYQSDSLDNFSSALNARTSPNSLIVSLDIATAPTCFAWQLIQTTQAEGYSFGTQTLLLENIQAAATQEGASSRVITAISWIAGKATYFSYGWQGDTSTVFEANVVSASTDTVRSAAATLAQQGYIITAVGGNTSDGFILVGTRVMGDSVPRPFTVWSPEHGPAAFGRGYSYVGHLFIANQGLTMWFLEQ